MLTCPYYTDVKTPSQEIGEEMSRRKTRMSNRKDGVQMNRETEKTPGGLLHDTARAMGMKDEPGADCGCLYRGDGVTTEGSLWFYCHESYFAVTKCDFVFLTDCMLYMPLAAMYLALRLDEANHLPPGKIVSFLEERGGAVRSPVKKGTRVRYTEILYFPVFYREHMEAVFPRLGETPAGVLRKMTGEHNWPADVHRILADVRDCGFAGTGAELFYVGKAYELMAALMRMASVRTPRDEADYAQLRAVIAFLDENACKRAPQKELLKIARMSPTKLKTLFRRFTGLSITDYISAKKVDRAAHLLSGTGKGVEEIASLTGFDTASGFATFFKKHTGVSPSAYRRQMAFHCTQNPSEGGIYKI